MPKATVSRLLAHKPELATIIALFPVSYSVFIPAPVQQRADSLYSLMVSQSLLRHHTASALARAVNSIAPSSTRPYRIIDRSLM